jgi:hypothetical protein
LEAYFDNPDKERLALAVVSYRARVFSDAINIGLAVQIAEVSPLQKSSTVTIKHWLREK